MTKILKRFKLMPEEKARFYNGDEIYKKLVPEGDNFVLPARM
jgi:hypothetical protein